MRAAALMATLTCLSLPVHAQPVPLDDPHVLDAQTPPPLPPPVVVARPLRVRRIDRGPLQDPATGRLSMFDTAQTLRRGQWSFTARGAITTEFSFGITDWLEVGIKNIPTLLLVEQGPKNTLWMGGLRLRVISRGWFTLTAAAEGLAFLGWAGLRAGLLSRLGGDRAALHFGASALQLWGVSSDGWEVPDSCEDCGTPKLTTLMTHGGGDVRVGRRVKLMLDVGYFGKSSEGLLLASPAVRVHGRHFAADFGVVIVHRLDKDAGFVVPLVNLSVSY